MRTGAMRIYIVEALGFQEIAGKLWVIMLVQGLAIGSDFCDLVKAIKDQRMGLGIGGQFKRLHGRLQRVDFVMAGVSPTLLLEDHRAYMIAFIES
ncbi:hypothetical protein Bca52824_001661 [Brassica carinata]|uniref:Uncharacterized protein n=1 Tax=Brassica carinata TaxID=52824 RepID=A0A8X7WHT9_BRACI|nr:hypothetical protein Bca52824_001661 [Brassica carinata]